jgi:hypothetical protein
MPPLAWVGIGHFSDIQAVRFNGRKRSVAENEVRLKPRRKRTFSQPALILVAIILAVLTDHASLSVSDVRLWHLTDIDAGAEHVRSLG